MKRTIGWTAHAACLAAILLAIWVPFGGRGQWITTAVVLLLLGAVLLGSPESKADRYAEDGIVRFGEGASLDTRRTYGKKAEDDR